MMPMTTPLWRSLRRKTIRTTSLMLLVRWGQTQAWYAIHTIQNAVCIIWIFAGNKDPGQLRVPRAKLFPDLVLHPVGQFQLTQNPHQQQTFSNDLQPQETGRQEFSYDYTDDVYEYPEYEYDDEDYYNYVEEDPVEQVGNQFDRRKQFTSSNDNSR